MQEVVAAQAPQPLLLQDLLIWAAEAAVVEVALTQYLRLELMVADLCFQQLVAPVVGV